MQNDAPPAACRDEPRVLRSGVQVDLKTHTAANQDHFIRWYQDPEIAHLLRHDLKPLSRRRAASYFTNVILPLSERGQCWAIHCHDTEQLVGTAAVTDVNTRRRTCLFRIVIGEKQVWGQGLGTEATRLVAAEVFGTLDVDRIRLEVFVHNPRARRAYDRVGFRQYDQYQETVPGTNTVIDIVAMELRREALAPNMPSAQSVPNEPRDAAPERSAHAIKQ